MPKDQTKPKVSELREQARKLVLKTKGQAMTTRSCWECNGAHEYLKDMGEEMVLMCFACGNYYYKGVKITEEEHEKEDC